MENALIKAEEINALEIFVSGKYQIILDSIKEKATIENPSTEKKKDRDLIKSTAANVARSKTLLESFGKNLADEKRALIESELKAINGARNEIKSFLDDLRDEVRKPLTDWETEKKAREEAEALEDLKAECYDLAIEDNKIFDQKAELAAERARLEKAEQDRKKEDEIKKRLEKEQEDRRLDDLKKQAQLTADNERLEREKIEHREQAKIDQESAVIAAEKKIQDEADQKERERLKKEADDKRIKEAKAADTEHRKKINKEALADLITLGHSEELAKKIIISIIQGKVRNVVINY